MLFNSFQFAIFLPIVFAIYWAVPHRFRWPFLLAASYYFYMSWNAKYVVLIMFTTLVSYLAALLLERWSGNATRKKLVVAAALVLCLGVLAVFKYANFALENICALAQLFAIQLHPMTVTLLLPVGISFYTFQTLSYVIDVYRGKVAAEHNLGVYATFVSFFPQLVAGPIERTSNLLPQIKAEHRFDYDQGMAGLRLIAWGCFKKMVVADNLAVYADAVYADPTAMSGFPLVLGTFFFAIQIYCDFSGYSDIARGVAKLLGIELMENFKSPYFSTTIKEFWSRWHISLSSWLRDYVYIPLGGNRCSKPRHYFNLLATFLVSGLWHGANWTYVVWGALHGCAQIFENVFGIKQCEKRAGRGYVLRVLWIFALACLAWVFFRAQSLGDAVYVLMHMLDGIASPLEYFETGFESIGIDRWHLAEIVLCMLLPLGVYDYLGALKGREAGELIAARPAWQRWLFYAFIVLIVCFLSPKGMPAEFVYFQF